MKVIITGSTGFVGEGVLLVCLEHPLVSEVLMVNRRRSERAHPKLKEVLVEDFARIGDYATQLSGYDACFYCAGVSSIGLSEEEFTRRTYDVVVPFADQLSQTNAGMVFNYVSGSRTDSSERGKVMWARVKGKTENALMRIPFKAQYNLRPGFMKPLKGQKNVNAVYRFFQALYPLWLLILPNWTCTMRQVGLAMINSVSKGFSKPILEVKDIKSLAR